MYTPTKILNTTILGTLEFLICHHYRHNPREHTLGLELIKRCGALTLKFTINDGVSYTHWFKRGTDGYISVYNSDEEEEELYNNNTKLYDYVCHHYNKWWFDEF